MKPDRMVIRYLSHALDRRVHDPVVQDLVFWTAYWLSQTYPWMTPRILDNAIWQYEREQR